MRAKIKQASRMSIKKYIDANCRSDIIKLCNGVR